MCGKNWLIRLTPIVIQIFRARGDKFAATHIFQLEVCTAQPHKSFLRVPKLCTDLAWSLTLLRVYTLFLRTYSKFVWKIKMRKRSQSTVYMLEHRDTYRQAYVCSKSHQGSSIDPCQPSSRFLLDQVLACWNPLPQSIDQIKFWHVRIRYLKVFDEVSVSELNPRPRTSREPSGGLFVFIVCL